MVKSEHELAQFLHLYIFSGLIVFTQVAPPFASGIVFLSAMLDRLTVQCFYNRDLLTILQARAKS